MVEIENNGHRYTIGKPLCGFDWLRRHIKDHTHSEIEALRIELSLDGKRFGVLKASDKRGIVKEVVELQGE